jgi:hypothetical protein
MHHFNLDGRASGSRESRREHALGGNLRRQVHCTGAESVPFRDSGDMFAQLPHSLQDEQLGERRFNPATVKVKIRLFFERVT